MKVPCEDCAIDAPENFSSMLQSKTKCFEMGWHVHKSKGGFKGTVFENENQYVTFMDDELFENIYGGIYD